jgi:hypothetical protein
MEVFMRATKVINGKTYTTPPFRTTTAALADPQNAQHALLRFEVFVQEWIDSVKLKGRKRRA